ncbi:transposase family protein, partial [Bradyrhizobium sp. 33ap4]|uniref:integrase catalytic domain-containing protein n=1 Tax=Bradyrhizobium sp. 33ap4 TaxID=3061630 RepID=UPI00292D0267
MNDLWQADLADVSKYKRYNRGHRYLLVVIDTLSRFLYVLPIKTKRPQDVKKAFVRIFRGGNVPVHLLTDRGREFHNRVLSDLFRKKGINHYSTYSDMKAASAERVIRTIKVRLFRFLRSMGTYAYLTVLP